jgi:hypothetical protein
MRRSTAKLLVAVGLLLVVAGSLLSWATVHTVGGAVEIDGWNRDAVWVVSGAAIAAVASWSASRLLAGAAAGLTAGAVAVIIYTLPGTLLTEIAGAYEAEVSTGLFLSMAGSAVLFATSLRRVG